MPNILPGARWEPINHAGRPRRGKGRGACAHVAVSESSNLRPWNANDWHFYLPRTGPAIQYVDMDYVANCQRDGNGTLVSWESQGGVHSSETEKWTDNQIEWGARIYAHLHRTEGAPLQVMPNSLSTSKGLGYHRLGVNPYRVTGGELWSSAYGKTCPGAAKIAQIPEIIARARQIVGGVEEDDMPTAEEVADAVWGAWIDRVTGGSQGVGPSTAWRFLQSAALHAQSGAFPFLAIRNSPEMSYQQSDGNVQKGDGSIALAAPGFWIRVTSPTYYNLYKARGLCGEPYNCAPNEYAHFRDLFSTPQAVDLEAFIPTIADAVAQAVLPHLPEEGTPGTVDWTRLNSEMQDAIRQVLRAV